MKWLFVILLAINLVYFGLELDRQTGIDLANNRDALTVPAGVKKLVLLRELPTPPLPGHEQQEEQDIVMEDEISPAQDESTADIRINEELVVDLVTQLPDISAPGISDNTQPQNIMCFSYGPFTEHQQSAELINWFQEHKVPAQQRLETQKENQLFWIYLKPGSRNSAIQAIEDLKSKGISDYRLIETGDLRNAISLGLFSTQASVNRRLNELKNKGYQPVVVPYRDAKAVYWLDIKLVEQQDVLNQMFTEFPARYNSVPVKCSEIALQ